MKRRRACGAVWLHYRSVHVHRCARRRHFFGRHRCCDVLCGKRWRTNQHSRKDRGDTLLETMVAMVVIALAAVAVLGGFTAAVGASVETQRHNELVALDRDYAEAATADVERAVDSSTGMTRYQSCATWATYAADLTDLPAVPSGYSVTTPTATYQDGTGAVFESTCKAGSTGMELFTVTASYGTMSQPLSFGIADLNYAPPSAD